MSMVTCKLCDAFVDSDEYPDGFYTLKYPDDYVCDSCREEHNLKTQFDKPGGSMIIINLESGIIETVSDLDAANKMRSGRYDIAFDDTATRTAYAELVNTFVINGNPGMHVFNAEFNRLFGKR